MSKIFKMKLYENCLTWLSCDKIYGDLWIRSIWMDWLLIIIVPFYILQSWYVRSRSESKFASGSFVSSSLICISTRCSSDPLEKIANSFCTGISDLLSLLNPAVGGRNVGDVSLLEAEDLMYSLLGCCCSMRINRPTNGWVW